MINIVENHAGIQSLSRSVLVDATAQYSHRLQRTIVLVAIDQTQSLHHLHAIVHAPKDRMLAIQPLRGRQRYEELRSVRVRARVGHRQNAGAAVLQIRMDLVGELLTVDTGAAATGAGRIAALDHEVADDAMEDGVVVVAATRQLGEIAARVGRMLPVQLDGDFAQAVITGIRAP